MNLGAGRQAFESVPWVRRAVVRRVWPNRLVVSLEEHQASAYWEGKAADANADSESVAESLLLNTHGEVFQANVGDVEDENLPTLAGPDGSAAQMLALYLRLQPLFARLDMAIERLELSSRGSWRVELDSGATVELGRGSDAEVLARTERFLRTLTQATSRWRAPLLYADLRHADGYAVRLRGVSTTNPTAGKSPPAGAPSAPVAAKTN